MAAQAGLCLAWSETLEDTFCRGVAHIVLLSDNVSRLHVFQLQNCEWYLNISKLKFIHLKSQEYHATSHVSHYSTWRCVVLNQSVPTMLPIRTRCLYRRVMRSKDVDGMTNSVDPDQLCSGSTLFAQTYLSESLGSLPYFGLFETLRNWSFR